MSSLLETGSELERALGPLVLVLHVGMCGVGASLAQAMMQTQAHAIAGPGACAGAGAAASSQERHQQGRRRVATDRTSYKD